jgi:hypothetical protein
MAFRLDVDPVARAQIEALPGRVVHALSDAFQLLELIPERGEPLNADNPGGGVYQLPFDAGRGLITYLLLVDLDRVDVLLVTWIDVDSDAD